jgi:hypothetical protein
MQLRQIQALLEMSKEESAMIIIYPMDSLAEGKSQALQRAHNQLSN